MYSPPFVVFCVSEQIDSKFVDFSGNFYSRSVVLLKMYQLVNFRANFRNRQKLGQETMSRQ